MPISGYLLIFTLIFTLVSAQIKAKIRVKTKGRWRPSLKLSLFTVVKDPYLSPHCAFEVVLGKVLGGVSFDAVYGKVLDIGLISVRLPIS